MASRRWCGAVSRCIHPHRSLQHLPHHLVRRRLHGGTAHRLFKLPPRNEAQKANLIKYGNYREF